MNHRHKELFNLSCDAIFFLYFSNKTKKKTDKIDQPTYVTHTI